MTTNYEQLRKEIIPVFKEEISVHGNYDWYETGSCMVYFAVEKEVDKEEYKELSKRDYNIIKIAHNLYPNVDIIDEQCYIILDCNYLDEFSSEVRYKKEIGNTLYAIVELTVGPEYDSYEDLDEEMECIDLDSTLVYALLKITKKN